MSSTRADDLWLMLLLWLSWLLLLLWLLLQCSCQRARARSCRPWASIQQTPVAATSGDDHPGWGELGAVVFDWAEVGGLGAVVFDWAEVGLGAVVFD